LKNFSTIITQDETLTEQTQHKLIEVDPGEVLFSPSEIHLRLETILNINRRTSLDYPSEAAKKNFGKKIIKLISEKLDTSSILSNLLIDCIEEKVDLGFRIFQRHYPDQFGIDPPLYGIPEATFAAALNHINNWGYEKSGEIDESKLQAKGYVSFNQFYFSKYPLSYALIPDMSIPPQKTVILIYQQPENKVMLTPHHYWLMQQLLEANHFDFNASSGVYSNFSQLSIREVLDCPTIKECLAGIIVIHWREFIV
jgi:hypothetical protein